MLQSHLGELAALATAICWSVSSISFESAGKRVGSLAVNYLRLIIGFILISIYSYVSRGYLLPTDASVSNWILLSISGFIGFFLGDLFLFQSYLEVGSRISMLIMASSPPISAILGYFILHEKLKSASIIGMVITLTGIAMVILSKDSDDKKIKISHSIKGIIYAFLGSLGQAVGLIFSKIGMGDYSPFAATQIRIITGFISFSLLILIRNKWKDVGLALRDRKAMSGISLGAIFGPFIGVSMSLISLKYTSAAISSTITSLTPITIIPFSIFVLKDKIKPKEFLGAIVSVIGVVLLFV